MGSQVDTLWLCVNPLWLFALGSRFDQFTLTNLCIVLLIAVGSWLVTSLLYWAHPVGPAWGRHSWMHLSRWTCKPIPGPRGWPVIGSLFLKTGLAHRKISAMAESCGPRAKRLMAFSVGETRMIVTCNPDVAKEILNSPDFSDRPDQESSYGLMFNRAIGFAPYGAYWRTLRRIASTHMFSPKQIKAYETQRKDIASQMVAVLGLQNGSFRVREVLKWASLSNMMGSVFGRKYDPFGDPNNKEVQELKEMVDEGYDLLGILTWSDHLSFLSPFDLQKVRFRCSQLVPKVNRFVSRIIAHHRSDPAQLNRDFVDVLLSLPPPDKLSDADMIAVLWVNATAVLMEWILARLVLHPDVQSKVHDELDTVVGKSRGVKESDVSSLVYLTAVIKEVMRLHPPGPLLAWSRLSIQDTTVDGCYVPARTTAAVNMWAIARDPEFWANPLEFKPERFLTSEPHMMEFSVLGSDLRLAPFGSGRRSCPGKVLGLTTVTFWVATLMHEFAWVTSADGQVDLTEELKLSCEMAHPLTVEVSPRTTRASKLSSC
ncbi:hypothetical protein Cgig2_030355 [Carnegiea gigantea]|uniref:Cytochrome P450 78A3 n=1 Tax=Carnegiea gigantea TaxID=171969 RepID=A0A9Q1KKX1_9CARY|nr:hypothetical protein Cgig2_030355 [Carnegiea gigantea]